MQIFEQMMRSAVTAMGRRLAYVDGLNSKKKGDYEEHPWDPPAGKAPNLVGSKLDCPEGVDPRSFDGLHAPCIDLDYPAYLIESSTPGHFHLYLEKKVPWDKYKAVLRALADADLIEEGYYNASVKHGGSYLRLPGEKKGK